MTVAGIPGAESQTAVQPTGVTDCTLAGTPGSVQGCLEQPSRVSKLPLPISSRSKNNVTQLN